MVEVIILIFSILSLIFLSIIFYSIIITNKNMSELTNKFETHAKDYATIEEENKKIRKWQAESLKKISEHL